jgi:hypothetical protein
MTSGRGNLTRRVQQLEELGARTKKRLPSAMIEADDDKDNDNDSESEQE